MIYNATTMPILTTGLENKMTFLIVLCVVAFIVVPIIKFIMDQKDK